MTAITSPHLAILRGNRTDGSRKIFAPRSYNVSVDPYEEVYAGQVDGDPLTDDQTLGIYACATKNESGLDSDALQNMITEFGSTPSARNQGRARLRFAGASGGQLALAETPPAALKIADNSYFSVKRSFHPALVLPRGVGTKTGTTYTNGIEMFVDYDIAYTDQNENFTPKPNITRSATTRFAPKPAAFVDDYRALTPLTYRTMVLSGALSFVIGSTITGYLWDVRDGTIVSGSSSTATITVRFPVGFRWISLIVTAANGKQGIMYYPIWCHDATDLPLRRFHSTRDLTKDWREIDGEFFAQTTDETVIPRGAAVCIWEDDPFWGETIPDQYRDQFLGWCREDTTLFKKYQSRNTLTVTGLGEWLSRYRPIPMRVYDPLTAAATWFEMEDIYNDKLAFHLLENFSTANRIANLWLSGNTDAEKSLDITGDSLFAQLNYIVQGYYGKARSDSLNALWVRKNYQYMTAAERAAVATMAALTAADRPFDFEFKLSQREYHAVASIFGAGAGFDGATNTIYNCRAPGRTPLDSNTEQDAPGQNLPATASQDALNQLTGAHLFVLNNPNPSVPYDLLPNLDAFEPAWGEPLSLTDVSADSGLVVSGDLFLLNEVNLAYDDPYGGRGKRASLSLEEVVNATTSEDAQYVEVITDPITPPDEAPPTDPIVPPTIPGPRVPAWNGVDQLPLKLFLLDSGGAHAAVAPWSVNMTSLASAVNISTGLTGYGIWACSDPYDYRTRYALMSTGLYRCTNIWAASPSWTLIATPTTMFGGPTYIGNFVAMSINRKGFVLVTSGPNCVSVSVDYGASWTRTAPAGGSPTPATSFTENNVMHAAISPYNTLADGRIYVMYSNPYFGVGSPVKLYRSSDWGQTWAQIADQAAMGWEIHQANTPCVIVPYIRTDGVTPNANDGSQEMFAVCGTGTGGATEGEILFSSDGGTSWTTQLSTGSSYAVSGSTTGYSLMTFTQNGSIVFFATRNPGGSRKSVDAGQTLGSAMAVGNNSNGSVGVNGYPVHSDAWLAWSRGAGSGSYTALNWKIAGVSGGIVASAMPSFFSDPDPAYVEWDISHLVAPA